MESGVPKMAPFGPILSYFKLIGAISSFDFVHLIVFFKFVKFESEKNGLDPWETKYFQKMACWAYFKPFLAIFGHFGL